MVSTLREKFKFADESERENRKRLPRLSDYLFFGQLRSHGKTPDGVWHTDGIFIHSKLMIVDDRVAVISSANLNDRSYLGDRDSEIGVVLGSLEQSSGTPLSRSLADSDSDSDAESEESDRVEQSGGDYVDKDAIEVTMAGRPYVASALVRSLRIQLMNEHVGLPLDDLNSLSDICSKRAWRRIWMEVARTNTELYEAAFPGIASDRFTTLAQYDAERFVDPDDALAAALDGKIRGHLQFHPQEFLAEERENTSLREYVMNVRLFV